MFKAVLILTAAILMLGFSTMLLWNWLLPTILGVSEINFAQATGLLMLSRLLFGNMRLRRKNDSKNELKKQEQTSSSLASNQHKESLV